VAATAGRRWSPGAKPRGPGRRGRAGSPRSTPAGGPHARGAASPMSWSFDDMRDSGKTCGGPPRRGADGRHDAIQAPAPLLRSLYPGRLPVQARDW